MISRVNLKYHSYRDALNTPLKEFDSASSNFTQANKTDVTSELGAWIFRLHSQDLLDEEKLKIDRAIIDEDKVPQPFLKHSFDPHVWMQVLATIDTSPLSPSIQFCDDQGYDVVPVRMVTPIYLEEMLDDDYVMYLHCTTNQVLKMGLRWTIEKTPE